MCSMYRLARSGGMSCHHRSASSGYRQASACYAMNGPLIREVGEFRSVVAQQSGSHSVTPRCMFVHRCEPGGDHRYRIAASLKQGSEISRQFAAGTSSCKKLWEARYQQCRRCPWTLVAFRGCLCLPMCVNSFFTLVIALLSSPLETAPSCWRTLHANIQAS